MKRYVKYIIILAIIIFLLPPLFYVCQVFYLHPKGYRFHSYDPEKDSPIIQEETVPTEEVPVAQEESEK